MLCSLDFSDFIFIHLVFGYIRIAAAVNVTAMSTSSASFTRLKYAKTKGKREMEMFTTARWQQVNTMHDGYVETKQHFVSF